MLSRNSAPEQTWKRCGENLVKYTPSGTYYVRVRVAGKLHVKSLETPVLTVARQRLNDEIHKLRARAASVMAVRAGKMRVADAVAIYRERLEADAHIKLSTRKYYEQVLTALLRSWPSLAETDVQRLSERDCRDWAAKVFREFSGTRANNTVMVLRNVLEIAVEAGALYSNPARALGRAKLRAKDLLLPSREQFIHFEKEIREVEDDIQETAQILFNSSRLAAVDFRKRSVSRGATSILTNPRSPFAETRLQEQRTVKCVAFR